MSLKSLLIVVVSIAIKSFAESAFSEFLIAENYIKAGKNITTHKMATFWNLKQKSREKVAAKCLQLPDAEPKIH